MFSSDIQAQREDLLKEFQDKYDLKFKSLELLNKALCHTSYTNENNLDILNSYERLEFLGDAVLKLSISKYFYSKFKDYHEGKLTKIRAEVVSDKTIATYANKIGLGKLILFGKNEKKHGGAKKESILACAFEALLGAIFLEYGSRGFKKAYDFLINNFEEEILNVNDEINFLNPKAILQEYTQGINHDLPKYNLVDEAGKEHLGAHALLQRSGADRGMVLPALGGVAWQNGKHRGKHRTRRTDPRARAGRYRSALADTALQ